MDDQWLERDETKVAAWPHMVSDQLLFGPRPALDVYFRFIRWRPNGLNNGPTDSSRSNRGRGTEQPSSNSVGRRATVPATTLRHVEGNLAPSNSTPTNSTPKAPAFHMPHAMGIEALLAQFIRAHSVYVTVVALSVSRLGGSAESRPTASAATQNCTCL